MSMLALNLNLLSNRLYQYVVRSPALLARRVEGQLKKTIGWSPRLNAPPTTHAVAWVREAADFHSRFYVFNYWTEHYGIPEMPVRVQVIRTGGKIAGEYSFTLKPRETRVVEATEVLSAAGIAGGFQGLFVFERVAPGAGFGAPFKMLQEYYGENFAAAIHEYGTRENFGYKEFQIGALITGEAEVDEIRIGLASCHFTARSAEPLRFVLLNAEGGRLEFSGPNLAAAESAFLSLNDLCHGWKKFLDGKPGNLGIHFSNSIGRPLVFHRYGRRGFWGMNHTTGDKSRQTHVLLGDSLRQSMSGPIWSAGLLVNDEVTSGVSVIQNFGFKVPVTLEGRLYGAGGDEVASFRHTLKPWETWLVPLEKHLPATVQKPWIGSVRINIIANPFIPQEYDANVEYQGQGWRQSVNLGASILNLPNKLDVKSDQVGRTKNFMRVRRDDEFETFLVMTNHSSNPDYAVASDTAIRLISRDGAREQAVKVSVPPRGTFFKSVEEIFPDARAFMGGDSVATLHIRDVKVKLIGIHLIRHRRTRAFAGDHYFGG